MLLNCTHRAYNLFIQQMTPPRWPAAASITASTVCHFVSRSLLLIIITPRTQPPKVQGYVIFGFYKDFIIIEKPYSHKLFNAPPASLFVCFLHFLFAYHNLANLPSEWPCQPASNSSRISHNFGVLVIMLAIVIGTAASEASSLVALDQLLTPV